MNRRLTYGAAAVCLLAGGLVFAQQTESPASMAGTVPHLVSFSGVVKDAGGQPRAGTLALTFSLYDQQDSNTPLWQEKQNVDADERGHYTVSLGLATANGIPLELFTSGRSLWLGVRPQAPAENEQPRVLMVSAPYALKAADADTLGGRPASAYALASSVSSPVTAGAGNTGSMGLPSFAPMASVQSACGSLSADGNAAAQQVALYSGACGLTEDSAFVDVSGRIGIGITAPTSSLDVRSTLTATSGTLTGADTLVTVNPSGNSTASSIGDLVQAGVRSGNASNVSTVLAEEFLAYHLGTGTVSTLEGMQGKVYNEAGGTVTAATGVYAQVRNTAAGSIGNGFGVYVDAPLNSGGGVFSNYYGLYLSNPTAATKNYSIYSAGGTNYLAGNVGIGTSTPAAKLEVNGTTKFDGLVTFAAGQTFPGGGGGGGGTITGVTAGTDLTGGGTSGNVTLNLDTTKVPELAAANNFTTVQSIQSDGAGLIVSAGRGADGIEGIYATGGDTADSSAGHAGPGVTGYGGGSNSGYGGAGIFGVGGYGPLGDGAGVTAKGGSVGQVLGYGLYAEGGYDPTTKHRGYSAYLEGPAYISVSGSYTSPQAELYQEMAGGYSRVRFSQTGVQAYWDIAAGGGSSSPMNFYRSDVGNIMSITPGDPSYPLLSMSNGAYLTSGGAWTNSSDRNLKTGFREIRGADVLRRLKGMPISEWSYKSEGEGVRHVGPTAQDFAAAFHLGSDDRHITTIDEGGVALAAIQELYRENQQLKAELAKLEARVGRLQRPAKRVVRGKRSVKVSF